MQDQTESWNTLVDLLRLRIEAQEKIISNYEEKDRLHEERYRKMVVKVENLRADLRRALDSVRQLEEQND